jgi:DNA-binding MarR family transcriptional regulator
MLLDLYAAHLESDDVTVTSLSVAAGVPATTAIRRMNELARHGLIEKSHDPADRRRLIVRLSRKGSESLARFIATLEGRSPTPFGTMSREPG